MKTKNLLLFLFICNFSALGVQIQYAKIKSSDELVNANTVERNKGPFICLECGEDLILRRGEIKQAHFAHKASNDNLCGGGVETYEHLLAKQVLVEYLDKWEFRCFCISKNCSNQLPPSGPFLACNGYEAQKEYPYDKYRVDVMLFKNNVENLALEVRHTHALNNEKIEFFNTCNLNMIEVDAVQIIKAYEDDSFMAKVIKSWCCKDCEERNKRPCLDCKKWLLPESLKEVTVPVGHNYPKAFVCDNCEDVCPLCKNITTKGQLTKYKSCVLCNQNVQEWQFQFNQAMNDKNIKKMKSLIKIAPPSLNKLDIKNKCKKVEQELKQEKIKQYERSLALEKQRKENMIEQWKNQVTQALSNKTDCDSLRRLLTTKPLHADLEEECELIRKELALCEIEEEKIIEQEAQKIVAQKKVCLEADYMKYAEELQRYSGQWYGANKWSVPIRNIQACAKWLKHSEKLIARVQALQKEEKITYASNKRKNPPPIEPVSKKQRITNFFVKK